MKWFGWIGIWLVVWLFTMVFGESKEPMDRFNGAVIVATVLTIGLALIAYGVQ